jgi:hypothetical protein
MTCNGSVKTWSVVPSADPNHPPVSHSTTCSGAPIHSVSCRGIAVPIACQ